MDFGNVTFTATAGKTYYILVESYDPGGGTCTLAVTCG